MRGRAEVCPVHRHQRPQEGLVLRAVVGAKNKIQFSFLIHLTLLSQEEAYRQERQSGQGRQHEGAVRERRMGAQRRDDGARRQVGPDVLVRQGRPGQGRAPRQQCQRGLGGPDVPRPPAGFHVRGEEGWGQRIPARCRHHSRVLRRRDHGDSREPRRLRPGLRAVAGPRARVRLLAVLHVRPAGLGPPAVDVHQQPGAR